MLEQLAGLVAKEMSTDTARKVLQLSFAPQETGRVTAPSTKAQQGALQPDEEAELDEYVRVADALAVLQSKARQALSRLEPRL